MLNKSNLAQARKRRAAIHNQIAQDASRQGNTDPSRGGERVTKATLDPSVDTPPTGTIRRARWQAGVGQASRRGWKRKRQEQRQQGLYHSIVSV